MKPLLRLLLLATSLAACAAPTPVAEQPTPNSSPTRASIFLPSVIGGPGATTITPTSAPTAYPVPSTDTPVQATAIPASPTPTETPAPTPTPIWPPARASLSGSKISLHSLGTGDPYVMEFIRHARPRIIKSVGDVGWLAEVKNASPGTLILARLTGWEREEWIAQSNPATVAAYVVETYGPQFAANPHVDYWEGWNEFVPVNAERMRWFAAFEAEYACQMQARGWRAAVGGFAAGTPELADMQLFLPALQAAQRCGAIFHLHEYNSPRMDCGVTAPGTPGIIPNAPALSVPAGPLTLRYRFWYELFLKPNGLGDLPLIISETGLDDVRGCPDLPSGPWKRVRDWWTGPGGLGGDDKQIYVNQLAWYDAQLRQDPYVLGATVFTVSALDPNNGWHPFDIHDILIPLAFYVAGQE